MKKYYFLGLAFCLAGSALAQSDDYVTPQVWEDVFCQKVSPNGKFIGGQDMFASVNLRNVETEEVTTYLNAYPGDGRFVANNGLMVGQSLETSMAVIMYDGIAATPRGINRYAYSAFNAVTPDASRAVGYYMDGAFGDNGMLYYPVYVEINASGAGTTVVTLPYPKRDLFGTVPQGYVPGCVSDDGKTITGFVTDGTGMYTYPIVWKQNDNDEWSYFLPTEQLFNLNGEPLPEYPGDEFPEPEPDPKDYMTPEEWIDYQEAVLADPVYEGWYKEFMTPEEYNAFMTARDEWWARAEKWYEKFDEYWEQMDKLAGNQNYGGSMVVSGDGKYMMTDWLGFFGETSTVADYYEPFLFNLEDNTLKRIESPYTNLIPAQILPNGMILYYSAPEDFLPYTAYISLPGEDEVIPFVQFLWQRIPSYYYWLEDEYGMYGIIGYDDNNQPIYGEYIITGVVNFSDDLNTIIGGFPIPGSMLTYIYYSPDGVDWSEIINTGTAPGITDNSVEDILSDNANNVYNVYNINGIRVLSTEDYSKVLALPRGLYIVNGKKIII